MSEFAVNVSESSVAGLAMSARKPAIGADRFRALTERLKKPSPLSALIAGQAVPLLVPDLVQAPAPVAPAISEAAPPATKFADETFAEPVEPSVENLQPIEEIHISDLVPEFFESVQSSVEPVNAKPELNDTVQPLEFALEPIQEITRNPFIEPLEPSKPEPLTPAVVASRVTEALMPSEVSVVSSDPMQRRLSGMMARELQPSQKLSSALVLPEILPPPAPPPPPPELEVIAPGVEAPSMEAVQSRLREDATARLEQLDIENIWRMALANPSLEERALYLREAAEFEALKAPSEVFNQELPPELDLSLIEPIKSHTVPFETTVLQPLEVEQAVSNTFAVESRPLALEPIMLQPSASSNVARCSDIEAMAPMELDAEPAVIFTPVPAIEPLTSEDAETAELARSLLDMMASGSSSGLPHERALASDTLLRMLPKLGLKPLMMLAERMAMMESPPHLIVGRLIRDVRPEVCGPLLENCMVISEQDLLNVAAEENPVKRRLLARRRRLSPAISSALIASRDPSVLLTLVRNAQAEISHDGFIALIECAGDMPDILAPLSTRNDLSAPFAFELFWKSPAQLRRYLLSRFLTDSETLTKILKITMATHSEDNSNASALSTGEMFETLAKACKGKIETSAEKIAEALQVSSLCVQRIFLDRGGEAVVVMLKAAGFPRGTLPDVLLALSRGDTPLIDSSRDLEELQMMFDTLSINKARILLTYWDWAARKSGPYAPLH